MRRHNRLSRAVLFLLAAFIFNVPGVRAEGMDYTIEISRKFGRGLLNVISSPLEIPCTIQSDVSEKGPSGIGTGFFKGTAFFLRRLLIGVTEVGTFMMPMEASIPPVCSKKPAADVQS
jgi:putative exosortase-associated protein (TIGR04073 family)